MEKRRRLLGRLVSVSVTLAMLVGIQAASSASADPLPAPPATVTVSQRPTMAALAWSPVEAANGYAVDYSTTSDFADATRATSREPSIVLTGLTPGTDYFVRVASCQPDGDSIGDWSGPLAFTTSSSHFPTPPPAVTVKEKTTTSVSATWTDLGKDLRYQASISKTPTGPDDPQTMDEPKGTFAKLTKDTTYYLSVRGVSDGGDPMTDWSAPTEVKTPEDVPLVVSSFNIKCASCRQGKEASWAKRKPAVVETILSQKPDVIGLQEASQGRLPGRRVAQYQDLVNGLGAPYAVTINHDIGGGAGVDNRIVYNTNTIEVVKTGVTPLPKGGKTRRYLAWAVLRHKLTGRVFVFGDTHLEPGKSKKAVRVRQTSTVLSTMKKLAPEGTPAIVVGDFNMFKWMSGGYKPYEMMQNAGFLDPLGNAYRSHSAAPSAFVENRVRTNYSTYNDYKRNAPRFSYDNGTQLDFIFVTKMRVSEWETVVKVDSSGRFIGTIPSDHNMVRATVWLPET